MKNKNKIICIVGPSGIGKTSCINQLINKYRMRKPTLITTRDRRKDDDSDYQYLTKDEFLKMVATNQFIEWDEYADHLYGTLIKDVYEIISDGSTPILDLTPNGCLQIKQKETNSLIIGIIPDNLNWLEKKLRKRNCQTEEDIRKRIENLSTYLKEMDSLNCYKVYAYLSPNKWPETIRAIEKLIFESG